MPIASFTINISRLKAAPISGSANISAINPITTAPIQCSGLFTIFPPEIHPSKRVEAPRTDNNVFRAKRVLSPASYPTASPRMTHRPSDTAWIIALMRVLAKKDPTFAAVISDSDEPYCRWFVEARPDTRKWLQVLSWEPLRRLLFANGERKTPGGMMHILLRKRYVEDQVRQFMEAADGKARQFVVFGAGMDPLPVRLLDEYPSATFFEIDHPNSLTVKQAAFVEHGIADPRLVLLPIDFSTQSAEARLPREGFRRDIPTFFLAEGLLMYLAQPDIDSLFTQVRSLSAPGSRFLFTFLDTDVLEDPRGKVAAISRRLEGIGEPLLSSMRPAEVATFVRTHRMRLLELISADDLRRHYLEPLGINRPILEGELLALVES